jgi:hypothetical protein
MDEKFSVYGEVYKNILKDQEKYMEEILKEI